MRSTLIKLLTGVLIGFIIPIELVAQGFNTDEYKKALWMTTRMYGGQRSGANNWLLYNHLPEGVDPSLRGLAFIKDQDTDGYDLSGGWHDCGDHVKFGQTEFYSGYILLKAFAEFPAGYDDYYSEDYKSYGLAGDWSWEGAKHGPNGIPDILDEVKHATDFFIKCARNSNTFYYQVGQGDPDHKNWVTAVKMQTLTKNEGGQIRTVYKNPADASMASFCGATLALMARMYRKFDPAYSDLCLKHARYAYDYAKAHPGVAGTGDGGFYEAPDNWKDDYADLCAELYWATGTESYKTEALTFSIADSPGQGADIFGKAYGFDYSNNGDIAVYNLALLGKPNAKTVMDNIIKKHYLANVQPDGQFAGGNASWGPLRYNANTALMVALWQKLMGSDSTPHKYIYDNIDYILGKNSSNQSFVVGFGENPVKFPHHRNVFLRDDNPPDNVKRTFEIPLKNQQFGFMVGGTRNPGTYEDDLVKYTHTEGGIDYNAGLVGALAFINSILSPVDTNKFGNPTPDLGPAQSICGKAEILLDSKIPVDNKKTFTWLKNETVIQAASLTANTLKVTSAGKYTCKLDSAGKWSTTSTVTITDTLNNINLGNNKELCSPSHITLTAGPAESGLTYTWKKDGLVLSDVNVSTLMVYTAGTYSVAINANNCTAKSASVMVTSKLPAVKHDTICKPGSAELSVSDQGGPFEWYDSEIEGIALGTGPVYKPVINTSKTFYVKDASSVSVTAGPLSSGHLLSGPQNVGSVGIKFKALIPFNITQVKILPYVYDCNTNDKVSLQLVLRQNGVALETYNSVPVSCTGAQSGAPFNTYYTVNFSVPIEIPAAGDYELIPTTNGNSLVWFNAGANFTLFDSPGVIDVVNDTRDDVQTSFPGIFDIKIQAGSTCDRAPVFAILDPAHLCDITTGINDGSVEGSAYQIYPNPSSDGYYLRSKDEVKVKIFDELGRRVMEMTGNDHLNFGNDLVPGIYHIVLYQLDKPVKSFNVIKN